MFLLLWKRILHVNNLIFSGTFCLALLLFVFSNILKVYAQGPGGVSANLQIWYKADAGVTGTTDISQWLDQSGNNYHINQVLGPAQQPALLTDDINFNPSISFNGSSEYFAIPTLNYASAGAIDKIYIFSVFKTGYSGGAYNSNWAFVDFDRSDYFDYYIQGGGNLGFSYSTSAIRDISGTNTSLNDDNAHLSMAYYDNSIVNDTRLRVDGVNDFTGDIEALTTNIGSGVTRYGFIGDGSEATTQDGPRNNIYYDGEIAEIFYYQGSTLSTTQIQQVESYLAIKYGITLDQASPQNYLASDGVTILFDATVNAGYLNDIAGIGRDDNSALDQQKSKSENSDARITLDKGGAFGTDLDFIMWGNDNGAISFITSGNHPSYSTILDRVWRTDISGTPGTVSLDFDLTGLKNTGTGTDYALLIDGVDADFTAGATVHTTGASIAGNTLTFTGINLSDGDYFTIAYNSPAPGGAITDLQLWLRSDRGVFEDVGGTDPAEQGDNVEVWQDQSLNDFLLINDFGGNPVYDIKSNQSTLDFSGGSNYLRGSSVITGTTARSMFVVLRPNSLTPGSANNAAFSLAPNASGGAGYGLFIEEPNGSNSGMGLRVSGNKLMDYNTDLVLPTIIQTQSDINEDVTDTDFFANGTSITDVSTQSANLLNTSSLGVIAGGFSSGADNDPEAIYDFDGDVYEVLVFDTELSALLREQVNSYLSIKHAITKQSADIGGTPAVDERDYIASDGSTILWDWDVNILYSNDIAGIIRDDVSDFELMASKSLNSDAIVTLDKGGSFTTDGDYFLWGNDDNPLTTTTVGAHPGYPERVSRVWKISTNGTSGTVSISFELGNGIKNTGIPADYAVLIDTDTDFSSGATAHTTGASIVGNTLTFTSVSFSNNDFFTLAAPQSKAPGGVTNNLQLWLRGDLGVTGAGNASAWADQSINGFSATQGTPADQPAILTEQINFNDVLDFDGGSDFMSITNGVFGNDTYDDANMFILSRTNTVQNSSILFETTSGASGRVNAHVPWGDDLIYYDGGGACCATNRITVAWGGTTAIPYLWSLYGSTTATPGGNNMEILRDGLSLATTASYNSWTGNSSDTFIGQTGSSDFFDGEIGEIVVYSGPLTSADQQKIHSYFAIKYGIAIDQSTPVDLISSNGTTIYGATTTHSGYLNDIAGIGRDEASALDQAKSKSLNSDAIITMDKGGVFSNDRDFIVWGNDDMDLASTDAGAHPSYPARVERIWKVDLSGTPGVVDIEIELVSGIYNSGNAADYALLIDTDTDFSAGATAYTTGASLVGNILSFTSVNFSDGDFFSIALPEAPGPGGKSLGLKVWLKANVGVTGGANASAWEDQSPFDHNLTQVTPAAQPAIVSEAINFNTALSFDNIDDYMPMETLNYSGTGSISDVAVFAVFNTGSNSGGQTDNWSFLDFDRSDYFNAYVWGTGELSLSYNIPAGTQDVQGITPLNDNLTHIGSVIYESASVLDSKIRYDGTEDLAVDQAATNSLIGSSNTRYAFVGDGSEADTFDGSRNNAYFSGQIAEVIYFQDETLSSTEIQQVESYLAIKYGITLDQSPAQDYLASDGTAIYNATTTHSGYLNDIAGIGRDDDSQLDQRKSISSSSDAIVTMDKGGPFSGDLDFIVWGNDDGSLTAGVGGVPAGYDGHLGRIWRVDLTGTPGTITLDIEIPDTEYNSGDPNDYAILIDSDTDFSDAAIHTTGASLAGDVLTFTNVSFNDNDFFTLAFPEMPVPGGVTGLALWYKGDLGVVGTTNANEWDDQSGNSFDAIQSMGTNQPAIIASAINFNTVLRYDGSDDYLPVSGLNYNTANSIDQIYAFVVFQSGFAGAAYNDNWAFLDFDRSEYFDVYLQGTGQLGFSYNGSAVQDITGTTNTLNDGIQHLGFTQYDNTITNDTRLRVDGADDLTSDVEADLEALGTGLTRFGILGDGSESAAFDDGNINAIHYEGDIAEIIYYQDQTLSTADINKIESYLAIKYGITLDQASPQDYTATNDVAVFDATANAGFSNDIAGIGRDDMTGLEQDKSVSGNSDAIITVALTDQGGDFSNPDTFDNDLEFLTWGNNDLVIDAGGVSDVDGVTILARLARVWKAQETGTVGTVTIQFDASQIEGPTGPGTNDLGNVRLLVDADGTFNTGATVIAPSTFDNGTDLVEFQHDFVGGSGFYFTLGSTNTTDTPLPIELIYFRAHSQDKTVELTWATAREIDNKEFVIERSMDAFNWSPIHSIDGPGNSMVKLEYEYTDLEPLFGTSYYRLRQTDFSGGFSYSNIVSVYLDIPVRIYPNPLEGNELYLLVEKRDLDEVRLYNVRGELVGRYIPKFVLNDASKALYKVELHEELNPEIYILKIRSDTDLRTLKLILN